MGASKFPIFQIRLLRIDPLKNGAANQTFCGYGLLRQLDNFFQIALGNSNQTVTVANQIVPACNSNIANLNINVNSIR